MARIETPKRIRGTQDIFGDEQRRFAHVLDTFDRVRRLYCFQRVEVPVFEATGAVILTVTNGALISNNEFRSNNLLTFESSNPDAVPVLSLTGKTAPTKSWLGIAAARRTT